MHADFFLGARDQALGSAHANLRMTEPHSISVSNMSQNDKDIAALTFDKNDFMLETTLT